MSKSIQLIVLLAINVLISGATVFVILERGEKTAFPQHQPAVTALRAVPEAAATVSSPPALDAGTRESVSEPPVPRTAESGRAAVYQSATLVQMETNNAVALGDRQRDIAGMQEALQKTLDEDPRLQELLRGAIQQRLNQERRNAQ